MLFKQTDKDHWEILETEGNEVEQLTLALEKFDRMFWLWEHSEYERGKAAFRLRKFGIDRVPDGEDEVPETEGWPVLSPEHEQALREFTRRQYKRHTFLAPSCHPVVRDEARRIDNEF